MKDMLLTFGFRWWLAGCAVALVAVVAGIVYETWMIRHDRDKL